LVAYIEREALAESFKIHGAEEDIWISERRGNRGMEKNLRVKDFYLCDQIKKNKMGRTCSTYGNESGEYRVLWDNLMKGDNVEKPGVEGRIVLKWILEIWYGGMNWISLA
jgi:hypothetical protein